MKVPDFAGLLAVLNLSFDPFPIFNFEACQQLVFRSDQSHRTKINAVSRFLTQ